MKENISKNKKLFKTSDNNKSGRHMEVVKKEAPETKLELLFVHVFFLVNFFGFVFNMKTHTEVCYPIFFRFDSISVLVQI